MRAFWLAVLLPLALAGWLAVRVSHEDDELRAHQVQALLDGRLVEVRARASQAVAAMERELGEALVDAPRAPDELRALGRRIPLASSVFRLDAKGRLRFPTAGPDASRAELEFLERTHSIWAGGAILDSGPGAGRDNLVDLASRLPQGWLSWYWAEGLHLLFWRRTEGGGVIGVEAERVGVLSRIVGALPTGELEDGRMELVDSRGQTVHQWGPMATTGAPPDAALALEPPLDAWQLRYTLSPDRRDALAGGDGLAMLLGLGALTLAMLGLAIYVAREYTRKLRDAASKVGFVTRVSHELRTPLTNIRMYAELLGDAAEDDDQTRRARVIVGETQRLGRLLDNVLAFARHQRGTLAPRAGRADVDEVIRDTVAKFEPALHARSIVVHLELTRPPPVRAGADTIDQIVANLVSNVEKYAAAGEEVTVSTREDAGRVVVSVADRGPGVPAREREAIFEPFHRASDSLTAANGTGIGLAIARDLARDAGGDLALADTPHGACFELTLPIAGDEP